jgi:hypothetical protein
MKEWLYEFNELLILMLFPASILGIIGIGISLCVYISKGKRDE